MTVGAEKIDVHRPHIHRQNAERLNRIDTKKDASLPAESPTAATSCRWPLANSTCESEIMRHSEILRGMQNLLDRHGPAALSVIRFLGPSRALSRCVASSIQG